MRTYATTLIAILGLIEKENHMFALLIGCKWGRQKCTTRNIRISYWHLWNLEGKFAPRKYWMFQHYSDFFVASQNQDYTRTHKWKQTRDKNALILCSTLPILRQNQNMSWDKLRWVGRTSKLIRGRLSTTTFLWTKFVNIGMALI